MLHQDIPLKDQFSYHPPTTSERIASHTKINEGALAYALIIDQVVTDPRCKEAALTALQQVRMYANQGVANDELRQTLPPKSV